MAGPKSIPTKILRLLANDISANFSNLTISPCHTVSMPFSQFHGRFLISHSFLNFKWIFPQTQFPKKANRGNKIPCQKISQHGPLNTKKIIINNFVIINSEASTMSTLEEPDPGITKNYMENIHQVSILIKVIFLEIVFVMTWKFFQNSYQKCLFECFY